MLTYRMTYVLVRTAPGLYLKTWPHAPLLKTCTLLVITKNKQISKVITFYSVSIASRQLYPSLMQDRIIPHLDSQGATVSDKNSLDTSTQHCFFHSWPASSSSQCCLSQSTDQILHTNIGRVQRQQSVPAILTETACSSHKHFNVRVLKNLVLRISTVC